LREAGVRGARLDEGRVMRVGQGAPVLVRPELVREREEVGPVTSLARRVVEQVGDSR
jgi:hypothetical protein